MAAPTIKELTSPKLSPPQGYQDDYLTWASVLRLLQNTANFMFTAEADGRWAGHVVCQAVADHGEVLTLYVNPLFRRQGLGRDLLNAALARCKLAGIKNVLLEVRISNIPARKLYETQGGELISHRRGYYAATTERPAEDAAVYQFIL